MIEFKLKVRVYTTLRKYYLEKYIKKITSYLEESKGLKVVEFDIVKIDTPEDIKIVHKYGKNRIDKTWFEENFTVPAEADGFNMVCFAFSEKEKENWGIPSTLGGSYFKDYGDNMFEFWVGVNPNKRNKRYKEFHNWARVFLHECSHGFSHFTGAKDDVDNTHTWDYKLDSVHKIFKTYDFTELNKARATVGILKRIEILYRSLLAKQRETLQLPIDANLFYNNVSQNFGNPDSAYKSGIHNGTDFAVVENTPVYAPTEVEIIDVYDQHSSMGNAFVARFKHEGVWHLMRCLHLNRKPEKGYFKKGEVIGYTGNTGMVSGSNGGYHLHLEVWQAFELDYNVLYNKESVLKTLHDPVSFFDERVSLEYRRDEKNK